MRMDIATKPASQPSGIRRALFGKLKRRASGNRRWSRDLGHFDSPWGVAACPVIISNLVIQNCDSDKDAYITALDKKTGKTIWRTPRPDNRGWSTPILVHTKKRDELVINGHTG